MTAEKFGWIAEVLQYLRKGRREFQKEAREKEVVADEEFQRSLRSTYRTNRVAHAIKTGARTNSDFIREVMRGHG